MNQIKRIKMSQKLQVKFHQHIYSLQLGLSLPEKKFIKDISKGMLGSGTVIVRQISQQLKESISLKKTSERLYNNLKKKGLSEKLEQNLLLKQCRNIKKDSLILIDPSDIMKPQSKKMEGLSKLRDGSNGKIGAGYDLLNIISYNQEDRGYSILPLYSSLYSKNEEIDTKASIILDRVCDITVYSGNKGIFVYDRGGDTRINIADFSKNENAYIIRSMGKRGLIVDNKELSFQKVCNKVELTYKFPGKKKGETILCGIKRVKVRLDPHPKKYPHTTETWLVVCRFKSKSGKLGGYFYLLCDFPQHQLSSKDLISKALESYRLRWKIEELHRQVKQDYGWEDMQLLSYTGLKNLNTILWIVISFLYSLKEISLQLAEAFPELLLDKKNKLDILYGFVYYRLFKLTKKIFSGFLKYKKNVFKQSNYEKYQLKISFL